VKEQKAKPWKRQNLSLKSEKISWKMASYILVVKMSMPQ